MSSLLYMLNQFQETIKKLFIILFYIISSILIELKTSSFLVTLLLSVKLQVSRECSQLSCNHKFKMHRALRPLLHSVGDSSNRDTLMNVNRRFFQGCGRYCTRSVCQT